MKQADLKIVGTPKPQGSKTAIRNKAGMIVGSREAGGAEFENWRGAVAEAALNTAIDIGGCIRGPVEVSVVFRFAMPASRPARFRATGCYKTTKPDSDKLIRALGDSLKSGGLIEDDAKIPVWHVKKIEVWQSWTGAVVRVRQLEEYRPAHTQPALPLVSQPAPVEPLQAGVPTMDLTETVIYA